MSMETDAVGEALMEPACRFTPTIFPGADGWVVALPLMPELVNRDDAQFEADQWRDRIDLVTGYTAFESAAS